MTAYIIRRVLYAIPIALGVSIVCFTLIYLAPGNPLQTLLPEDASAENRYYCQESLWLRQAHSAAISHLAGPSHYR